MSKIKTQSLDISYKNLYISFEKLGSVQKTLEVHPEFSVLIFEDYSEKLNHEFLDKDLQIIGENNHSIE